jgi:hypothetical protein
MLGMAMAAKMAQRRKACHSHIQSWWERCGVEGVACDADEGDDQDNFERINNVVGEL